MNPHFFTAPFFFAFIWFRVQGSWLRRRLHRFFYWGDAWKWHLSHQSPVIPLISGAWIVSHMWHEILRRSPHLFWLVFFSHRAFLSAQDDDTGERVV